MATTVEELLATNNLYKSNQAEWHFLMALYEGIREVIKLGLIKRHEREPMSSYRDRVEKLFGLGYSKSISEIFHFFLFKKEPQQTLGPLHDDVLWQLFVNDSDLFGNDYNAVIMDIAQYSVVLGHMGILVDKASTQFANRAEQIDKKVYPYIAKYFPSNILDWQIDRDDYNRPYLSYIKLLDDNGQYRLWYPNTWEIYELPKDKNGKPDSTNLSAEAVLISSGVNPLGLIPFIWHYNLKSKKQGIGVSDIHEVSRIDLSIIRNLSQIEQIIDFAAFPMMRKPMRDAKPTEINAPQQDDEVGVESILEFDPENPDSKPDWLQSEVKEPIEAIIDVITRKVSEIYRASNIGGMAATEPTRNAQSGVAKRTDFQLLNSKLVSKAINLETAENKILEYWLRWENMWEQYSGKVSIARERTYDIEELAVELANSLTAKTLVISTTFDSMVQKQAARQVLPSATEKELAAIDEEIDTNVRKPLADASSYTIDERTLDDEDLKIIDDAMEPSSSSSSTTSQTTSQQSETATNNEEDFGSMSN